ncbi:hypothetical protein Micbo1qcDRAFT_167030, partial [Microdochium bolleyi]
MHASYIALAALLTTATHAARKKVLDASDVPTACTATCQFALTQTQTCDDDNRRKNGFLTCVCTAPDAQVLLT